MEFNFHIFSASFLIGCMMALFLSCVMWMRRPAPGSLPFAIFFLAVSLWTLEYALEAAAVDYSVRVFWGKAEYFGSLSAGVLWLCFALDYTGSHWWRRTRNWILLSVFPVITLIVIWTNDWHHWFYTSIYPSSDPDAIFLIYKHGFFFWLAVVYQYMMFGIGIFLLLRYELIRARKFHLQTAILILGTLIPVIYNLIYVLVDHSSNWMNMIPLLLLLTGGVYCIAILRFHFLDVVPAARGVLVEKMPDGILVLNTEGCIADINPAAVQSLELYRKVVIGQKLSLVYPKLESLVSSEPGSHREMVTESGLCLEIDYIPLKNKQDKELGQLVVLRDITERKRTQKKLESLYQEERWLSNSLQAEMEKRNKYTRALVHELNTPLTSILASGEILEMEVQEKPLADLVKNIRRASDNLKQRIDELIELARGEVGLLKISVMPMDMGELIEEVIQEMRPKASGKGLTLETEIVPLPLVSGDRSRLREVLVNLVGNAIRYTSQGTIRVKTVNEGPDKVLVQIKDTGRGIEIEEMKDLFDPYRRKGNEGQELGGLGIGLALSKIIIDLHQGQIWADSVPGKGSIFSFTVPVFQDQKKQKD